MKEIKSRSARLNLLKLSVAAILIGIVIILAI